MGQREVYLEHRKNGRFLRAVRMGGHKSQLTIGSNRDVDIRVLDKNVSGIHAVLEYKNSKWIVRDLGSEQGTEVNGEKIIDHFVQGKTTIKFGPHEIKISPLRTPTALFGKPEANEGSSTHQQVVVSYKGRTFDTKVLGINESFTHMLGGKDIVLPAPKGKEWVVTEYDGVTVRQRLVSLPKTVGRDGISLDKEVGRSATMVVIALMFLFPISYLFNKKPNSEQAPTKITQMIYDAKIIKKKREKAAEVRTRLNGSNNRINEVKENNAGQVRVGKNTVSTKVISNIKASGLSKLIGKIAVRAGNAAMVVTSAGSVETNSIAQGVVSGTTIKGNFENNKSDGFKVSKVTTGGKAGGSNAYKDGSDLAIGSVGTGDVGVAEEEAIVDGGLDREVIASIIKESLGQVRYCYERQLSADPGLMGKVQIKFTIGATGNVVSQQIGISTLNNAMVEGCILRRVARWKFPTPKGGTSVLVTYPFLFKALN